MRREDLIGAGLALLVLTALIAHWSLRHADVPALDGLPAIGDVLPVLGVDPIPTPLPPRPPPPPISLAPLPDDEETRALRAALAPSGIPLGTLGVITESGGRRLYGLVTEGSLAVATWHGLRERVDATGFWPVAIGGGEQADLAEAMRDGELTPQSIVADADAIDTDAWLIARRAQVGAYLEHGSWPPTFGAVVPDENSLTIGRDILTMLPQPEVLIALVPTRDGSEAPAWLGFGNYNDCPATAAHVALFRRWHERYGAEVYGLSGDVAEMIVTRPPTDRDGAMRLADEQAVYAYDIVAQGTGTVEVLAGTLLGSPIWFFWWD